MFGPMGAARVDELKAALDEVLKKQCVIFEVCVVLSECFLTSQVPMTYMPNATIEL